MPTESLLVVKQWQASAGIRAMDLVITAVGLGLFVYDVVGHRDNSSFNRCYDSLENAIADDARTYTRVQSQNLILGARGALLLFRGCPFDNEEYCLSA